MFQAKKQKRILEDAKRILKETASKLEQIENEKKELHLMKKVLEDSSPKVDISNLYVYEENRIYFIVERIDKETIGRAVYYNKAVKCVRTTLIDIFTKKAIYDELNLVKMTSSYLKPILSVDHSLLVFPDQKVPFYLLQQLFYKLNNISLEESEYVKKLNYNSEKK